MEPRVVFCLLLLHSVTIAVTAVVSTLTRSKSLFYPHIYASRLYLKHNSKIPLIILSFNLTSHKHDYSSSKVVANSKKAVASNFYLNLPF